MSYLVSAVAALIGVGFLAVSASMNLSFGLDLGNTEMQKYIYGGMSVCADILKAALPFLVFYAYKNARYFAVSAGVILFVLCTSYSVMSGLGFAQKTRQDNVALRSGKVADYDDLRADLKRDLSRLDALGLSRPVATIKADMSRLKQDVRWGSTKACKDATIRKSREFCKNFLSFEAELGTAREGEKVRAEIARVKKKIENAKTDGRVGDINPQTSILSKLTGFDTEKIDISIVLLVAVLAELGSSFGLFVALSHGEFGRKETTNSKDMVLHKDFENDAADTDDGFGGPADYLVNRLLERKGEMRLIEGKGGRVSLAKLHTDYCRWCSENDLLALSRSKFNTGFLVVADQTDIKTKKQGRAIYCLDMQLLERAKAA